VGGWKKGRTIRDHRKRRIRGSHSQSSKKKNQKRGVVRRGEWWDSKKGADWQGGAPRKPQKSHLQNALSDVGVGAKRCRRGKKKKGTYG